MARTTVLLLSAVVVGVGLLGVRRHDARMTAEREAAVETSRIRAWARAHGGAGVSVLPKRVPAADPAELRRLDHLPGFDAYADRCGSCHDLPDPAAYSPDRWIGKIDEMREPITRAGVMPPEKEEWEAVATFLRAASTRLRPGE